MTFSHRCYVCTRIKATIPIRSSVDIATANPNSPIASSHSSYPPPSSCSSSQSPCLPHTECQRADGSNSLECQAATLFLGGFQRKNTRCSRWWSRKSTRIQGTPKRYIAAKERRNTSFLHCEILKAFARVIEIGNGFSAVVKNTIHYKGGHKLHRVVMNGLPLIRGSKPHVENHLVERSEVVVLAA